MTDIQALRDDPRVLRALDDFKQAILERYPGAAFQVSYGGEPEGVYLEPIVDVDDMFEVLDVIMDRMLEVQIEEGLPVYVVPLRSMANASGIRA